MMTAPSLNFEAVDLTGQRQVRLRGVPADATVGELLEDLLGRLSLPRSSAEGRPLSYHPLLQRESRHLHNSEIVGEAIKEDDRLVLHPSIEAGRGAVPSRR